MSGYADWMDAGKPWTPAQPIADLTRTLRGYGYTVYQLGNPAHQRAVPPEDHMPYSATGWPVPNPRWFEHACDIMAPTRSDLPNLAALGAQMVLDRNTGVPGASPIKYLNWQPAGGGIRHEAWDPTHRVGPSDDGGHIHLSVRSDCTHSAAMAGYDPVARLRGGGGHAVAPGVPESATIPAWPGAYYKLTSPMSHAAGIMTWQRQAHARGNTISVDGWFGAQTNSVVRTVQTRAHLAVDGIIGPNTWTTIFA